MTQIFYTYYTVHIWNDDKNVLLKFIKPSLWPPTVRTWIRWLIALYMKGCSRACIALWLFVFSYALLTYLLTYTANFGLDDLKNRVRTWWENLDQQVIDKNLLIVGITNWRLWFIIILLLLQNLYSAQIQASSSQRRWRIARWGTWLAGVGKKVSFETAFERGNGW